MGKEEKHKTAQEGGGKKPKVPAAEERSQKFSQEKLIRGESSVGRGGQPQLPQVLWAGCCESPLG